MKAYLANSLFSQADLIYNEVIASRLREEFEIDLYVPQENTAINEKSSYANSIMISRGDDEQLLDSDFLIAVIDGVEIDSGVACEIGKFAGFDINYQLRTGKKPRPIFALFTDTRQQGRDNPKKLQALRVEATENQFPYRNLYVVGTIKNSGGIISSSIDELVEDIKWYLERKDK